MTKGKFALTSCAVSVLLFVVWAVIRISAANSFSERVGGYLANYSEAGNITAAKENLNMAIKALEEMRLTEGQVSIFHKNPNNNIGLWYQNLKESQNILEKLSEENAFNQSIALEEQKNGLKGGASNTSIKHPDGISIYPHNKIFFWWSILSLSGAIGFLIWYAILCNNCEQNHLLIQLKNKEMVS